MSCGLTLRTVTEGRNLSMRGKEAPDAQCIVGPVDDAGNIIVSKAVKTDVVRNSARPVWSAVFNLSVFSLLTQTCCV